MTVVTLGNLPSNAPLPTGRGESMQPGTGSGGEWNYNNTVAPGNLIGGWVGLGITPARDAHWHVSVNCIWRSPDDIWSRVDWGMHLSQPDLDGWQNYYSLNWAHGNTVDWQHGRCDGIFRLQGGVYYTCYAYFFGSTNNNQIVFASEHITMSGHLVSEACI